MLSNSVKINFNILGIVLIIGAGVYAELNATAGLADNLLLAGFLLATLTAFLAAFSRYEFAQSETVKAISIYLMRICPNSKLPTFLLGYVLVVTVVAPAATASFLGNNSPLTKMLFNIVSGWGPMIAFLSEVLLSTFIIDRMVYVLAPKKGLMKLPVSFFSSVVFSTRATSL
jgi:hypothetical protein